MDLQTENPLKGLSAFGKEAEILADCLRAIESGRANMADCLAQYPGFAADLEPMLRAAAEVRALGGGARPALSADRIAAGQRKLLAAWSSQRPKRRAFADRPRRMRALPRWAAGMAALVLALALGAGTVAAAGDSLPGEPLYGLKRAAEKVQLALTPAGARPALHARLAATRLQEFSSLAQQGQIEETTLAEMKIATQAALEGAQGIPDEKKQALLAKLAELTERQQAVLADVLARAPESAQPGLQRALEASQHGHQRAMQALSGERVTGPPDHARKPTETPSPSESDLPASQTPAPSETSATPEPTRRHGPPPDVTRGPKQTPPGHALSTAEGPAQSTAEGQGGLSPGQARQTEKATTSQAPAHTPPGQANKPTDVGGGNGGANGQQP